MSGVYMPREIGIIGLGDMGGKIAERLHRGGFSLVLYDRSMEKRDVFKDMERVRLAGDLDGFAQMLRVPDGDAVVWTMLQPER